MFDGRRCGGVSVIRWPVDENLAGIRKLEARDHPQQRRLPAARRPQQRKELAAPDRQVDAVHRRDAAEALADAIDLNKRRVRHAPTIVCLRSFMPWLRTHSAITTSTADATRISAPSASTAGSLEGKRNCPQM